MQNSAVKTKQVQLVVVDENHAGQRVDNFLFSFLKGVPKSRIYRMLRKGEVRVNRGRIAAQHKLVAGDQIRIPPVTVSDRPEALAPSDRFRVLMTDRTVYEDDFIWVINKPPGIPVHGGSGQKSGLIEGLRQLRPELRFLELVHRLDRDTSGCLILAKKRVALTELHGQFRDDRVGKTYVALLNGVWNKKSLQVDAPLKKNTLKGGERIVRVDQDGKTARTDFRRLEKMPGCTLVEAHPASGRTHQIRVHAAHMGYPLAGDDRYAPSEANRRWQQLGLRRLFLHARQLVFHHPDGGFLQTVNAELDPDLQLLLERLKSEAAI